MTRSPDEKFLFLALGGAIFYVATLQFAYTHDGMAWAILLELQAARGSLRFEAPHYLVFFFASEAGYFLVRGLSGIRALPFLQILCAVSAGIALALFERLLARAGFRRIARAVGVVALATAPSFWRFATSPEVYPLAYALWFLAILAGRPEGNLFHRTLGFLLPVLGHQSLATFGVAQLLEIRSVAGRWAPALAAGAVAVACFLLFGFAAHAASPEIHIPYWRWILGHAQPSSTGGAAEFWATPADALHGLRTRPLRDFSLLPPLGAVLAAAGFAGLIGAAHRKDPIGRLLLIFVPSHLVFVLSWDASGNDFWQFFFVPAAYGLVHLASVRPALAVAAALLVCANAAATWHLEIGRNQTPESNPRIARASSIAVAIRPIDRLILPNAGRTSDDVVYLPYLAGRSYLHVDWILDDAGGGSETRLLRLEERIDSAAAAERARGGRLFAVRELIEDPGVADRYVRRYGIARDSWIAFVEAHRGAPRGAHLFEWLPEKDLGGGSGERPREGADGVGGDGAQSRDRLLRRPQGEPIEEARPQGPEAR